MNERKRPRPLRALLRFLAWILAALLCVLLLFYVIPLTEHGDESAVAGSAGWMALLDDALPLNEIVLPGTHDSATQHVQLAFFSKCQGQDIAGQLASGYRYLDLRLAVDNARLKLMHGFTNCRTGDAPWSPALYLDAVLDQCYAFLDAHPSETVVLAVKKEHGDESVEQFQRILDGYIQAAPDYWLLCTEMPLLGEARGRLVLLRRYEDEAGLGADAGLPLRWKEQSGNGDVRLAAEVSDQGGYRLWVQDRYEYSADDKWNAFLRGMTQAEGESGAISLNFLSTKGPMKYGHPYRFACDLNERLAALDSGALRGWVVVDFASAPLAEHIYNANFE